MRETSKAYSRRKLEPVFWNSVFKGDGIDIGAGEDSFRSDWFSVKSVRPFDVQDGDAQEISKYVKDNFDFVHSSNCLEHMIDPLGALKQWWGLVKPGGYLVFTVPDEDLYEQGVFPSQWNDDHKWTFTVWKSKSWSCKSVNVAEMISSLSDCCVKRVGVIDSGYDYSVESMDQTCLNAEAFIEVVLYKKMKPELKQGAFKHSGARGDIVYSLPTIQALGGGVLYLVRDSGAYIGKSMSECELSWFRDLLVGQCGITDVLPWNGEHVQYNLDKFRSIKRDNDGHLSVAHLNAFGVSFDLSCPWLERSKFSPKHVADIVINRSGRYSGPLRWQELAGWIHRAVFVGFEEEWLSFKRMTGFDDLPLYKPESYVDLCNVLLGSRLYIGNQSFIYSLAEALKVNRIQEASLICPNCMPQSDNGHVVISPEILDFYVGSEQHERGFGGFDFTRSMMSVRNRFFGTALPRPYKLIFPVGGRPLVSILAIGDGEFSEKRFDSVESREVFRVGSVMEVEACLQKTKGDFICLIEDNVHVSGMWFQDLIRLMSHERVGAVGQKLELLPCLHVNGGIIVLQRKAWQECGLFGGNGNFWVEMGERFKKGGYSMRQAGSRNITIREE
jgi:SAM-dependent methyltransferase